MITIFKKLELEEQKLITEAEQAMINGYDPYSFFYVGCAILASNGKIYTGSNINTCSYGGLCAERNAIGSAITDGEYKFLKIAIIAKSKFFNVTDLSGPCGICRQMIWEFAELNKNKTVILSSDTKKNKVLKITIDKLHPKGFGPRLCGGKINKYIK